MINKCRSLFTNMITIGCHLKYNYEETRRIVYLNFVVWLWMFLTVPYVFVFYLINHTFLAVSSLLIVMVFVLCLYLIQRGLLLWSRIVFILTINIAVVLFSLNVGNAGFQYVLFALMPVTLMIFNDQQKNIQKVLIGAQIVSFTFVEYFIYSYDLFLNYTFFPKKIIYYTIIFNCFIIIYSSFWILSNIFQHYKYVLKNILMIYGVTERESEIIYYTVFGKSNNDIARLLFIEESTVKKHLTSIFKKLNVTSRVQLMSKISISN